MFLTGFSFLFLYRLASNDFSLTATSIVQTASPVMLTAVLNMSRKWSMLVRDPITSIGMPNDGNTRDNVAMPEKGTAWVLVEAIMIRNITVRIEDMLRLIPMDCAANMTATPCMIAVPFLLIVAPRGMVYEVMLAETPISSNLFMLNGIVAFEDSVENANKITVMNRL